ncbi:SusC/RagA family TonB-linked outer membrane protein [Pedobacter frigidisoli]|uniref:SusC/RagA family TonB-linked outer membrane protein n=1 Tax=Pedobacter frigidisoli TaxID=2530455 RepID=UPI002930F9E6|nr:SusC/RagA family TonB-linked outer membrane protein [Pedobacter frigidisoli]
MIFFYKVCPRIFFNLSLLFLVSIGTSNAISLSETQKVQRQDTIRGNIIDANGKPVVGADVFNTRQALTARSNSEGKFSIPAVSGDRLQFKAKGFNIKLLTLSGEGSIVIRLTEAFLGQNDSLQYSFTKKATGSILGSVSTIYTNELLCAPVSSTLIAMAGRLPGFNVLQSNGFPIRDGDGQSLPENLSASIRGYTGITSGGNPELIMLIDGAPRPFTSIDPEEIASVSILKDGLSTVMYGQRSSPGIVSIITKKGMRGAARLSFTAQTAIQSPLAFPSTLNAFEYASLYNKTQLYANPGAMPKYTQAALDAYRTGSDPYLFPNVDWKDVILKDKTSLSRYNFNVQGGNSTVHYFVSLDYLHEGGLFNTAAFNTYSTNSDNNRYIARSNVGIDLNKSLKLDVGIFARIQDGNQPGGNDAQSILNGILTTPALAYPVNNANGTYGGNSAYSTNLLGRSVQSGYSITNTRDLAFDLGLTQRLDQFVDGLFVKASGNVNLATSYLTNRTKTYAVVPITGTSLNGYTYGTPIGTNTDIPQPVSGTARGSAQYRQTYSYLEAMAGYDRSFTNHNISSRLLADVQSSIRNQDIPVTYTTYAANFSYNYSTRYFAEVAGSYSGFNQFAKGHQYEPYYAIGLGWNITNEEFLNQSANWLNNLKVRTTYGKTGYVNRGSYGYFDYIYRYANSGTYSYYTQTASSVQGYNETGLANADLEGEKARKFNLGIDVGLFKSKLNLTADFFVNNIYDMMAVRGNGLQVLGTSFPYENIGKQRYEGFEFTATYKNNFNNFSYFISANAALVRSKQLEFGELIQENQYQQRTGMPVGSRYGLTSAGLFRSQAEINTSATPSDILKSSILPGDIKYVDRNGDGIIDARDEGVIGNLNPQLVYGATVGFNFKNVDFSLLLQGVQNRDVYISGDAEWAFRNSGLGNAFKHNLDAYSPENPNSNYPRLTIGTNQNNEKTSTFWLHNGSFLRLKNVQLGYTFPHSLTSKIKIPSARLFVSGENLLVSSPLSKYRNDVDPEVFGASYPMQRIFNFGVNIKL